jgi:hypothetical protein
MATAREVTFFTTIDLNVKYSNNYKYIAYSYSPYIKH